MRILVFALLLSLSALVTAEVGLKKVFSGLPNPIDIAHDGASKGRMYIAQQNGIVRLAERGVLNPQTFLDVSGLISTGGERGLLGLAFHPQYAVNGYLFVNYTRRGDGATVIARYTRSAADPLLVDAGSAKILLIIAQPYANHNGGQLRFGPDGYLYIAMGDGGSGNDPQNYAQDLSSLLGKMLRIDVDRGDPYSIPADNPFVASSTARGEIWASGLRNPWRFSFDRATGDLFIGDVGQGALEEIDYVRANTAGPLNFGWRIMEGSLCTNLGGGVACRDPSLTGPIIEYGRNLGCSVTGGFRYRGGFVPEIAGRYVYGDFCTGRIWAAEFIPGFGWNSVEALRAAINISTFGEDEQGELYVADHTRGDIYRLVTVDRINDVVEFYNRDLNHYFLSASADESNAVEAYAAGSGWQRTGHKFSAYPSLTSDTVPVCRFYGTPGRGPNSHFYTGSEQECEAVKRDPGWFYEGIVFYSRLPSSGVCPASTTTVFRLYNNRAAQNDSNHRYTTNLDVYEEMRSQGWIGEGVVFCSADA